MSELNGSESRNRNRNRRSSRTPPQTTQPDPLICPRCQSTNTKFCYYNNYNKTQPRYFCKACKRHWTSGGILRNVPVGGGRKNKRLRWPVKPATATNQETYDHEPKSKFFTQVSGEKKDDESYIDIDEFKGLVSWDLYGSELVHVQDQDQDYPPFSRLLSSFDTNPNSNIQISLMSWKDLESMVLEDMNKPWEDPTFKT